MNDLLGTDFDLRDRLLPDLFRSIDRREPLQLRHPQAIRPWQHVLEPLSGYLLLAEKLHEQGSTPSQSFAEGWNFGPIEDDAKPVQWIVESMVNHWGNGASWQLDGGQHPHEANYLKLDISKVKKHLGWYPCWGLDTALEKIIHWHKAWLNGENIKQVCLQQIQEYSQRRIDTQ